MLRRRSLVRTLDPGFTLVLIHRVFSCPLSLPRVGSVKFHFFDDDIFLELLQRVSGRQDGLEKVQFGGVKGIGELDVKFDVEVT